MPLIQWGSWDSRKSSTENSPKGSATRGLASTTTGPFTMSVPPQFSGAPSEEGVGAVRVAGGLVGAGLLGSGSLGLLGLLRLGGVGVGLGLHHALQVLDQ